MLENYQTIDLPEKDLYDTYEEVLINLHRLSAMLYGGYYEPKSRRDVKLAEQIDNVLSKHPNLIRIEEMLAGKKRIRDNWLKNLPGVNKDLLENDY